MTETRAMDLEGMVKRVTTKERKLAALRDKRYAKAQASLKAWLTRYRRAAKKVRKLTKTVKYYELLMEGK